MAKGRRREEKEEEEKRLLGNTLPPIFERAFGSKPSLEKGCGKKKDEMRGGEDKGEIAKRKSRNAPPTFWARPVSRWKVFSAPASFPVRFLSGGSPPWKKYSRG